jgi:hypothetical protein
MTEILGFPKKGGINDGTIVHLEGQRRDLKRSAEFVVEPTGKKESGDKNDHIGRPLYSFIDRHCSSPFRCGEERERLFPKWIG